MAYVPQQIPKEEENKFALNQPTTPNPVPPQGSGSAGAGGAGSNRAAPGFATSTQFGSNAAKLSDYLKANEDQVGQFGQQIAGDLSNRYNQTMAGIDQGFQGFNQGVQGQYAPPDPNQVKNALDNPADFVKDSNNVKQFQGWYNPQYNGPQNFEGSSVYSGINDQVNKAVQDAGLTSTQSGLGTYLNNYMGGNDNTEGMRVLDTALLQRNPNSNAAIKAAAQPYQNLGSYLQDTTSKANQGIANVKGQIQQSGQDVQNQTKGATDAFTKSLQDRIAQSRTGAQGNDAAFMAALKQGTPMTDAEKKLYGVSNWDDILKLQKQLAAPTPFGDSQAKYGQKTDLTPYLTKLNPDTAFSMANVANPDEYAREAALQQLTGGQYNVLPDDLSAAGTAPKTLSQFNSAQAGTDLQKQLGGLDQQFLDQYKDFNLGAGDANYWLNLLKDPNQAQAYQGMIDIYGRNPTLTNPLQQGVSNQLQQWLQQDKTLPQGGGGTDTQANPNLRIVDGKQMWFNGSGWVQAPQETKTNPDGTWSKFNYNTGQYETQGGTMPTLGFRGTPGVF